MLRTYHRFSGGWYVEIPESWDERVTISRAEALEGARGGLTFSDWKGSAQVDPIFTIYAFTGEKRLERAQEDGRFLLLEQPDSTKKRLRMMEEKRNKTLGCILPTPNAPGQRVFLRCAASFFLEIRQYSCEKMSCATQKSLAAGHIMSFQIHPILISCPKYRLCWSALFLYSGIWGETLRTYVHGAAGKINPAILPVRTYAPKYRKTRLYWVWQSLRYRRSPRPADRRHL